MVISRLTYIFLTQTLTLYDASFIYTSTFKFMILYAIFINEDIQGYGHPHTQCCKLVNSSSLKYLS